MKEQISISKLVQHVSASETLSLGARIQELKNQGRSIIDLTVGEPDFETPPHIKRAGIESIRQGPTRYTPAAGMPALRSTIAQKLWRQNHIRVTPSQVVVGAGSKHLIHTALQVLCDPGDEVLVPFPTWPTYLAQVQLVCARARTIALQPPFVLTAHDIETALTKRSKVLILNSPANPTSAVIPKTELERISEIVVDRGLTVISDEIYEAFTYGSPHVSIASLGKDIAERTVTINGFSKSYAMTGWRVGYATGPLHVMEKFSALQSQTISCASSISQMAALAAMTGSQRCVQRMKVKYRRRLQYLSQALSRTPGISVIQPQGTFYLFFSIEELLSAPCPDSSSWCQQLLSEAGVALVPGDVFYALGYVRLSATASLKTLKKAVNRLRRFVMRRLS